VLVKSGADDDDDDDIPIGHGLGLTAFGHHEVCNQSIVSRKSADTGRKKMNARVYVRSRCAKETKAITRGSDTLFTGPRNHMTGHQIGDPHATR
jgi:hypothetical protein